MTWSCLPSLPRRALSVMALIGLLGGCDEGLDEDPMPDEIAPVVQLRSAQALVSGTGLARISALFGADLPDWLPEDSRLSWAVAAVRIKLETFGCLVVDSDDATFVEVTWSDQCQSRALTAAGSIRGDATLASVPCDTGTCEVVRWTVDARELELMVLGQPVQSKYRGLLSIDAPIDGGPLGWDTSRMFELDFGVGTYAVESRARWSVDADDCVTLDLDAELELVEPREGLPEAIEEEIGTIVVTTQDMRRCPQACPDAGEVYLSYGRGKYLQWTFGARDDHREVEVFTPRGKSFLAELPCNDR